MQKIKVLDSSGKEIKSLDVSEDVLLVSKINKHVIFDSVNIENQNKRQGTHDTKSKAEVSGTGKKPYKQKHTGRARQGSKRNPQFRGGGIAFGVTPEKNYKIKINKKVSKIALVSVWQEILKLQNVAILDESFSAVKTKEFHEFLKNAKLLDKKILFMFDKEDSNVFLSSRNIPNVICKESKKCSVRDLLNQNFLLMTVRAFETFEVNLKTWK